MRKQLLTILTITAMITVLAMMAIPAIANAQTMEVLLTDSQARTAINEQVFQSGMVEKVQKMIPDNTQPPWELPPDHPDDTQPPWELPPIYPDDTTNTPPGDDTPSDDTTDTPPDDTTDTPGGSTSGGNEPDKPDKPRKTLAYTGGAASIFVSLGLVIMILGAGLMARGAFRNKQEL